MSAICIMDGWPFVSTIVTGGNNCDEEDFAYRVHDGHAGRRGQDLNPQTGAYGGRRAGSLQAANHLPNPVAGWAA